MTLSLSHWYPGSGVVLDCIDCIDSLSLPLSYFVYQKSFSFFSTKIYVVGTQKNCLKETVF